MHSRNGKGNREPTPAPSRAMADYLAADPSKPEEVEAELARVPADQKPKRILFERDFTYLPGLRAAQKPGLCCFCELPLPKGRRYWCSAACYSDAYLVSIKKDWDETRRKVLECDNYTCQDCGKDCRRIDPWARNRRDRAEVDHIVPVEEAPEKQYDMDNLRTLCGACHRKRHGRPVKTGPGGPKTVKTGGGPEYAEMPLPEEPIARKRKSTEVEAIVLQNYGLPDVARLTNLEENTVRGVWGAMKAKGTVPKDAIPGRLEGKERRALPVSSTPAPVSLVPAPAETASQSPMVAATPLQPPLPQVQPLVQPQPQSPLQLSVPAPALLNPLGLQPAYHSPIPGVEIVPMKAGERMDNGGGGVRAPTQVLSVEASGMVAKVFNNPKMLLWFDWFRNKYRYEGDYSDFLEGCVDDFFRSRGWEISVNKKESLSS